MRALLLNGAYESGDAVDRLAQPARRVLASAATEVLPLTLREKDIAFCSGCFGCWTTHRGACVVEDDGYDLAQEARNCDLLVFLTPVVFGGYGWQLKKAVDRLLPDLAPYFLSEQSPLPSNQFAALLGIGVMTEEDEIEASMFLSLVERNASNYHSARHACLVVDAQIPPESFQGKLSAALATLEAQA
jgi:multimeric flavodoxin WrbA